MIRTHTMQECKAYKMKTESFRTPFFGSAWALHGVRFCVRCFR